MGSAFNSSKADKELRLIASDPDETHAFKVTNYMALNGLLEKLQQKIIRMEGESFRVLATGRQTTLSWEAMTALTFL